MVNENHMQLNDVAERLLFDNLIELGEDEWMYVDVAALETSPNEVFVIRIMRASTES